VNRRLVTRLVLLLVPVLAAGVFCRVWYTPDEPREADLVAAMVAQPSALPSLGGVTFAEKPPLLYWLGAAAVATAGGTPSAARLPNVLYGLVTALALAYIARRAAGPTAGYLTGVVSVTALQLYAAMIWLATDAPLLAGVALSLAGLYAAITTEVPAARRRGYGVLALGCVVAFYAKGPAGWIVPGFATLTVFLLEKRWRDGWRSGPWWVLPLVLLCIAPWIVAVHGRSDGDASLNVLFWYNLVGRAVVLDGAGDLTYAAGHPNSLGKYVLELPVYLFPWTALSLAAFVRGFRYVRLPGATGSAWRLAYGAVVPSTVLLSIAATARGVYYAPPLLGFALMIGLAVGEESAATSPTRGSALALTRGLIVLYAVLVGAVALLLLCAPTTRDGLHLALAVVAALGTVFSVHRGLRAGGTRDRVVRDLSVAVAATLVCVAAPMWWGLNPWVDLEATAQEVRAAVGDRPLRLYRPDETTVAMADLYLDHATALGHDERPADPNVRYLWLVPDHYRWKPAQWLRRLGYRQESVAVVSPPVVAPDDLPRARVEALIERAGGRRYAVLAVEPLTPPEAP
jgi:4-amino-4-deoxy-L-arabinose transferase-like glycosyltransferase